jgi:nucleotide-binding universal stress UspA family protein
LKQAGSDQSSVQRTEWKTQRIAGVPGRDTSGYSTILVAIDGSESSAQAGRHAVDLAKSLQAVLVVFSVINVELAPRTGIHRILALAELERDSWVVARQTKELADESGVECEGWSAWDPRPSRAIVGAAEEVKADCIVIGSPGTSAVDRLFARAVGGTHDKVIRQARCPVLSVR